MNFIFDFDGTLANTYPFIVDQVYKCLEKLKIHYDKKFINEYILDTSLIDFFKYVVKQNKVSLSKLDESFNSIEVDYSLCELMPNTIKMLKKLKQKGHRLFIYTHRGVSLYKIIKNLDIEKYFDEIVDFTFGFKAKPDPEGIEYLVKKYKLNKNETYYIGDRELDINCANNAKVKSFFYKSNDVVDINNIKPTYIIKDFLEVLTIIK